LPEETVQALRRLLAEALVRDYLDDKQGVNRQDGGRPLGDANQPVGEGEGRQ
jgi:hypothetical protein